MTATANLDAARKLYAAFDGQDARALIAAITPDFRGVVADGMPAGLGGTYEGAEEMLRECWAPLAVLIDVRPVPAEYLPVGEDRMVVVGRYAGTVRASGQPLSAAFVHLLRFAEGRVSELVQVTDTARWQQALG